MSNSTTSFRTSFLKFTIIPMIPLVIISFITTNSDWWTLDSNDHFYFEIISVILSFIIAYYCILRGYAFSDRFTLFIGLGFHAEGFVDVLHAIILVTQQGLDYEGITEQTWMAGRLIMAIVLVIAIARFGSRQNTIQNAIISRKTVFSYIIGLTILAVGITILSLSITLPFLVIDHIIHRPYELAVVGLFLTGLIYFYKYRLYEQNDNFYKGILIALTISIFVNIINSFSSDIFGTAANTARILKNVSFVVFILALASSVIQQYKIKEDLTNQIKKVERQKDEFSIMITHELKNPLTPIIGWCDALRKPNLLGTINEIQDRAIYTIRKDATRLKDLINAILDVRRFEMNEVQFHHTEISIKKLLDQIITNFEPIAKEQNITLTKTFNGDIEIKSDESRIIQVFTNLIQNAIDFVPKNNGIIEINVTENPKDIIFSIKDNGIGISEENQKNLFKKFYQIDTSLTRKHAGVGLGLSICKGIIEGLGGKIWVSSTPGIGSTFYFSMPKY